LLLHLGMRPNQEQWVPHPFAHFAKGWESTNLNSQFFS
jgi:hypothetical protein